MAYGNGYTYRRSVTVDNTKVSGSSDHSSFPMLFSGTYSYLATTGNGGKLETGYDFIFTSDANGSTTLSYEIEEHDTSTGEVIIWVKIPTLSHDSDTTIYLFYGNSGVSTSQESITDVWDSNYVAVYHCNNTPTGSAGDVVDSTSNSNDGTTVYMGSSDLVSAAVGNGFEYNGTNENFSAADSTSFDDITSQITVSCFAKITGTGYNNGDILGKRGAGNVGSWVLLAIDSGEFRWYIKDSATWRGPAGASYTLNTQHHLFATYNGSNVSLSMDGGSYSNFSYTGDIDETDVDVYSGKNENQGSFLPVIVDELRVSKTARTLDWGKTSRNSMISPSTFYDIGNEEAGGGLIDNQIAGMTKTTGIYKLSL